MLHTVRAAAAIAALIALGAAPVDTARETIQRHFTPADRESGRYQYVPFEVPSGVTEMTIAYRYDGAAGASVIDLGVIEPGPLTLGTTNFRGYSGGATRAVTIARDHATPGYLAGPIPAGRWHVLLGLYRVAPAGVDVTIDLALTSGANAPAAIAVRASDGPTPAAAAPGPRWFSGALHLHTTHSDGTIGPNALAAAARDAGLDFITITDHNNTTHRHEPADHALPLRIVGEEITTAGGHANAWGLRPGTLADFRVRPEDPGAAKAIEALVAYAHAAGALFSINHPFGECVGCSWQQAVPSALDAIEIWNGRGGPQAESIRLWDRLLQSGKRVTAVGASDWHRGPDPIDAPAVRVFAKTLTEADVLAAIREGRIIVMRNARQTPPSVVARCGRSEAGVGESLACAGTDAATIDVTVPALLDGRIEVLWSGESIASKPGGTATIALPAGSGYARVHVLSNDGETVAITNPVYVTRQ